jgi:hypothetical protein
VVPADRDREPGSRHNTLVRSSTGDLTPETADAAHTERRHRTPGFLEEAATQNAERLHGPLGGRMERRIWTGLKHMLENDEGARSS